MFLTDEDPRAVVKGTVDPLGITPIWVSFGRTIIANLTTQSNSARGFTTLILGRYFTNKLLDAGRIDEDAAVDVFLRTEQICAYVRHNQLGVEGDIRGINRVRERARNSRIPIGTSDDEKIMSNQERYGLWGLFSVPARISGLIDDGDIGLPRAVQEFVDETYWPRFQSVETSLFGLLCDGGYLNGKSTQVQDAFGAVLSEQFTEREKRFYAEYLLNGDYVTEGKLAIQSTFINLLLDKISRDQSIGRVQFETLRAAAENESKDLTERLDRIIRVESVVAPASLALTYLLSKDGFSVDEVAAAFQEIWGTHVPNIDPALNRDLLPLIGQAHAGEEISGFFDRCQRALTDSDYVQLVETLVAWNAEIQARRGGAPWLTVQQDRKLAVRYRMFERHLPEPDELRNLWRNSYFVASAQNIARQLQSGT